MKILYIYKYAILGGVTTQLVNRISYLKEHIECHVLYIQDHGGTKAFRDFNNIKVERNTSKIAEYIDREAFDFVICIDTMEAYEALKKCKHKPVVISEVHTTTSNLEHLKEVKREMPMDAFITPSNYLKDRILNEYGYAEAKRCYVVENCLDTEVFHTQYKVDKPSKKIIGWIGKLDDHKNWRKFIGMMTQLIVTNKEIEIWLVGGYTAPQYTVQDFIKELDTCNLMDYVKWYPYIEYNEMPRLYRQIALSGGCTISTSKNESFGMTAAEAMACKCPLVMPSVGALPEVMDGKLAQYLYEYNDEDTAISLMRQILTADDRRMVEEGYDKVYNCYSIDKVGEKYIQVLNTIRNNKINKNSSK